MATTLEDIQKTMPAPAGTPMTQADRMLLEELEAPVKRQELVRRELYRIIDTAIAHHCPAFRAWNETRDETRWAEVPAVAILLRSRFLTAANVAIDARRFAAHDEIRQGIESACAEKARQLLRLRSEEISSRKRKHTERMA